MTEKQLQDTSINREAQRPNALEIDVRVPRSIQRMRDAVTELSGICDQFEKGELKTLEDQRKAMEKFRNLLSDSTRAFNSDLVFSTNNGESGLAVTSMGRAMLAGYDKEDRNAGLIEKGNIQNGHADIRKGVFQLSGIDES